MRLHVCGSQHAEHIIIFVAEHVCLLKRGPQTLSKILFNDQHVNQCQCLLSMMSNKYLQMVLVFSMTHIGFKTQKSTNI